MITPLCGNGMSMAMHAGKIAGEEISEFLKGTIPREKMEQEYTEKWNKLFARRLRTGRMLQRLFDTQWLTTLTIKLGRSFPSIIRKLIKQTHGDHF